MDAAPPLPCALCSPLLPSLLTLWYHEPPYGQVTGDPLLYTSRELGSQTRAYDNANGCNVSSVLPWLQSQSNWAAVPFASARFRLPATSAFRTGVTVWGRERWP